MRPITIGDYSIGRVAELEFPAFAALEFFPAATPDMLEEARRALPGRFDADGKLIMSFHSFVLRTGRHTILIDTCCNKSRPGRSQFDEGKADYMGGLAAIGVKPEEVTHVMCTHLHWDHVGWNTQLVDGQWVPTFPNAQYVMAKREYDHWDAVYAKEKDTRANVHALAFEDSVLPLIRAEKAILVEDDFDLDHGVSLEPCPGHTPGHVIVNVEFERPARRLRRRRHPSSDAASVPGSVDPRRFRHGRRAGLPPRADRQARRHRQPGDAASLLDTGLRHHRAGRQRVPFRFCGRHLNP